MIDYNEWKNNLTTEQITALSCILLAQRLIYTNGDTEHNLAIREVISAIADKYDVIPGESYRTL
jgi:hypothetical protein